MSGLCSICLNEYDEPVSIPCGHVYCIGCIVGVANETEDEATTAKCPKCRDEFHLVSPDLTYLPKKYHPFVVSPLRRIFLDESGEAEQIDTALSRIEQLERELAKCRTRLADSRENEDAARQQGDRHLSKARVYREKEKAALKEVKRLESTCERLETKCEELEDTVEELSSKMEEVELRAEQKDVETKAEQRRMQRQNAALQKEVKRLKDESQSWLNQYRSLEEENKALEVDLERMKARSLAQEAEATPRNAKRFSADSPLSDAELAFSTRVVRPLPKRRKVHVYDEGSASTFGNLNPFRKSRISI
ncbi:hypothetical protein D9611_014382 [Ephemerocybe angulata]|uniref:RING-type domain-containing protein n=1 Tax=Ephemerocybe angulata TaxID=980116 RepID=A0A8H5F995_9AGAR|nr:hypothetical protein D9611_014382 [Tulosesus angulatus]